MYKLICTDVDGTLVDKNGTLLDCDKKALEKAYESGIKIAIFSGRYRSGVKKVADLFDFPIWYSCFNGLYLEADDGKVLYKHKPDKKDLAKVVDLINDVGSYPLLFSSTDWYVQSKGYFYELQKKVMVPEGSHVGDLKDFLADDSTEIFKVLAKDLSHEKLVSLQERFEQENISGLCSVFSNPNILEFLPYGTDKAKSVEVFSEYLNIDKSQVIAFGDYDNDVGMLKAAGMGVAMGNATQSCKDCADFITKTVTEGGIAFALNQLL